MHSEQTWLLRSVFLFWRRPAHYFMDRTSATIRKLFARHKAGSPLSDAEKNLPATFPPRPSSALRSLPADCVHPCAQGIHGSHGLLQRGVHDERPNSFRLN